MPLIIFRIFMVNLFFVLCFMFYQERGKNDIYEEIPKSETPIIISIGGVFKNEGNSFLNKLVTKYNIQLNLVPIEVESDIKIINFSDIVQYPEFTLIGSYLKNEKNYAAIISKKENLTPYEYIALLNTLNEKKSINSLKNNQIFSDLNTFNFLLKDVKYKEDVFIKWNSPYNFEKQNYTPQYIFFTILIALILFFIERIITAIIDNDDFAIFVLLTVICSLLIIFTLV